MALFRLFAVAGASVRAGGHQCEVTAFDETLRSGPHAAAAMHCRAPIWNYQTNDSRLRFVTRGLNKVKAETALSVLAYNILRAINLVGASGLRASLA